MPKLPGPVVQSVASLTADPGREFHPGPVPYLFSSADSRRVVTSKVCNRLVRLAQE